jgi:hypothetical protein
VLQACPTGRRLVQDLYLDYNTILVGGTLEDRTKVVFLVLMVKFYF